ncbi:hypothetical protein OG21DRAFT_315030 [Imleria badia]|nr:hypothetical protein OG21DRAFT_315030 [Imleria badia]
MAFSWPFTHTVMEPRTLHALELTWAIVGQTVFLAAAWGFLGAVFASDPLTVSDFLANLIHSKPTETTWIVTLVATALSVATTTFLSIAFKEALRHRMHKSISLIHLSGGIALARGAFLINFRHPGPALVTLAVFAVTRLLVSSWAALLAPTQVTRIVNASGWELDLTSGSFESMLQQELVQSGVALVRGNSTQILDLNGMLSGIAAAEYSFGTGTSGIFNFNGVKYNVSTGGILPAAPGYGGTTDPVSADNTGLAFAGGLVPTHLDVNFPKGHVAQGLRQGFTLQQQGLTGNVSCQQTDSTSNILNLDSSFYPIPVPFANGTTDYWLWAWNITGDCNEGQPSQQRYVTRSNSSTVPQSASSGLISSLVCPYPLGQSGFSWEQFTVVTNASWKYDFLPLTVCTINPLITTSLVNYSSGAISTTVVGSRSLGSSNTNLTQFLAAIIDYQGRTTQSLTTNSIGDALYSIYVSTSGSNSSSTDDVTEFLLREMEHYWQGVIEFSGTFLRSAFSVYPRDVPIEAQIPVIGNETITTMGWYHRSVAWGYMIIPITIVALMVYAAVAYTLWSIFIERGPSFTRFDPSNPVQLMMVSSARDRDDVKDNLGDRLAGFEHGGIGRNENLRVELTDVTGSDHKRFKVTND